MRGEGEGEFVAVFYQYEACMGPVWRVNLTVNVIVPDEMLTARKRGKKKEGCEDELWGKSDFLRVLLLINSRHWVGLVFLGCRYGEGWNLCAPARQYDDDNDVSEFQDGGERDSAAEMGARDVLRTGEKGGRGLFVHIASCGAGSVGFLT